MQSSDADAAAPTDVHALHAPGPGPFPPATKIKIVLGEVMNVCAQKKNTCCCAVAAPDEAAVAVVTAVAAADVAAAVAAIASGCSC